MDIRDAKIEDLKAITELMNQMYEELDYRLSFTAEFVKGRLKSRFFIIKVLLREDEIVGFCTVKIIKNEYPSRACEETMAFLYEIYIAPDNRRKGLAKLLLAEMEKELLSAGVSYMELYTGENNKSALNFWEARGCTVKHKVMCKTLKE